MFKSKPPLLLTFFHSLYCPKLRGGLKYTVPKNEAATAIIYKDISENLHNIGSEINRRSLGGYEESY